MGDYVKTGSSRPRYNLFMNNCKHVAGRLMGLGRGGMCN